MVGLALFPQLLNLGFLLGGKNGGYLCFHVLHGGVQLLMQSPGPGFFFGSKCFLSSLLTKLPQFFAGRFTAGEALLKNRANLLLLIVGQIQFAQYAGTKAAVSSGSAAEAAIFTASHSFRSSGGVLSSRLLSLGDGAERGQ